MYARMHKSVPMGSHLINTKIKAHGTQSFPKHLNTRLYKNSEEDNNLGLIHFNENYMYMQLPIQIFKLTHLVISGKTCGHYKIFSPLQNGLLLILALKC